MYTEQITNHTKACKDAKYSVCPTCVICGKEASYAIVETNESGSHTVYYCQSHAQFFDPEDGGLWRWATAQWEIMDGAVGNPITITTNHWMLTLLGLHYRA